MVSHDVVRPWPGCRPRIEVVLVLTCSRLIRNVDSSDRVHPEGRAVPAGDGKAGARDPGTSVVVGEHRISLADVMESLEDRLWRPGLPMFPGVQLEVADPQHQLGHAGGPGLSSMPKNCSGLTPIRGAGPPRATSVSTTSASRRFISSMLTYRKLPVPHAGSSTFVSWRCPRKRSTRVRAFLRAASLPSFLSRVF